MLRSNCTFESLDETIENIDGEFRTLENVIHTVFEILEEYEKLVEQSK